MKASLWIVLMLVLMEGCATAPTPSTLTVTATPAPPTKPVNCPGDNEQLAVRFTAFAEAWQGHQQQRPYMVEDEVTEMLMDNYRALLLCLEAAYGEDPDAVRNHSVLSTWISPQNLVCGGPWEFPGRRVSECQQQLHGGSQS